MKRTAKKDPNVYPKGWNRKRVEAVIAHYDGQSEKDAIAEAEVAWANASFSLVRVPTEHLREVNKFIEQLGKHKQSTRSTSRRKSA